jgi:hypothetical protein
VLRQLHLDYFLTFVAVVATTEPVAAVVVVKLIFMHLFLEFLMLSPDLIKALIMRIFIYHRRLYSLLC